MYENKNIKFIDCISRSAGIPIIDKEATYIESPTMLEKTVLEIMNIFKGIEHDVDKYLVIDSLSSLVIYNEPEIVREFVSVLLNKARSYNIHIVTIVIEEEVDAAFMALRCFKAKRMVNPTVLEDAELRSIKVPALYLVGENEKIYSAQKAVERLNTVAPQIRTEIIPNAGHDLTMVQAEMVNRKVLEFLKQP